jgi:hypothetical protein
VVRPVMGRGAVGHGAASDERATRPAMGRRAVEHSAVANERAMGEWARIMSGHAALGPADKHKGDRGGWTDKHEGVGDFVFFLFGPAPREPRPDRSHGHTLELDHFRYSYLFDK